MGQTDQMIARYIAEIEERQAFVDGIFTAADGKDLSDDQLGLVTDTKKRMEEVNAKLDPLMEMRRISGDSAGRVAEIAKYMSSQPTPAREVEYRSAGAYVLDVWKAGLGAGEAQDRLEIFNRAAAHQTTSDNPGLIPTTILGPIINFVDESRPLVNALGARQLPGSGSWARPKITQHTQVAAQSAEKAELVSRKMTITSTPLTPTTYGGYVNVSRQDADWSNPQIMDIVIGDLAGQYAIVTEAALGTALVAGGTAATAGTTIPTGAATAAGVASAVWAAAGAVLTATSGTGRLILAVAPDMLGVIGPVFPPISPQNAQSSGFQAADQVTGPNGSISGVAVVVSAGLAAGTMLMLSTAAAEVYEDRVGALQVVEPSVLGVQVAYAGYFTQIVLLATGIQKIVKTP